VNERATAIITGAGTGIGRATAIMLAKHGLRIALVGRREDVLRETAAVIGDASALSIKADIAEPAEARRVADRALERLGRIDALVNNAGHVEPVPLPRIDQPHLDRMFAVIVFGPIHLIARLWPAFVRQGGARVVSVSSMSTLDPFPGLAGYAAAKTALESVSRSIMREGAAHGIRAFSIAPGSVETAMLRRVATHESLPSDRTLDPNDVAKVIVECVLGRCDTQAGNIIRIPSP
jgi:NAD(P)-dependent dehydrogenase (short-subunit alcohol dehydrogenase family)